MGNRGGRTLLLKERDGEPGGGPSWDQAPELTWRMADRVELLAEGWGEAPKLKPLPATLSLEKLLLSLAIRKISFHWLICGGQD